MFSYLVCTICHEKKPVDAFHGRSRQTPTGLREYRSRQCKACEHAARNAYNHTEAGKQYLARQKLALETDPERRARYEAYQTSEAAQASRREYEKSDKGKARMERFLLSEKGEKYRTEKWRRHRVKRADLIEQSGDTLAPWQWRKILRAYRHACAYCASTYGPMEPDHVVPVTKGGANIKENIVPACHACNQKKGDETGWIPNPPSLVLKW